MSIAVFTVVHNGMSNIKRSFSSLRRGGVEYKHYVVDNASTDGTTEWLKEQESLGRIDWLYCSQKNLGFSIGANVALDVLMEDRPDWVVRWDAGVLGHTKRMLRKLVKISEEAEKETLLILSPSFGTEEEFVGYAKVNGHTVHGVGKMDLWCSVAPGYVFGDFRFNKFNPLAYGDANEVADLITKRQIGGHNATLGVATTIHAENMAPDPEEVDLYVGFGL